MTDATHGDRVSRTLTIAAVLAALGGVAVTATLGAILALPIAQRTQHATLDAASVAVRDALGDGDRPHAIARLAALHESLETWGISAAAFDRAGTFVAGDVDLRGDGLPEGRVPAVPAGRQMAMVPIRDGYVVLVADARTLTWQRALLGGGAVAAVALSAALAWFFGSRWASARGAAARRISTRLRHDGVENAAAMPVHVVESDPLFGALSADIAAALERRQRSLAERAGDRDRLRAFLADAGHELRTPLAIAIGYVGILERGGLEDAGLAARIVRDVAEQHARLQQLVERILQLARLDAMPPDPEASCDVAATLAEAVALVRPLAPERTIAIPGAGAAPGGYRAAVAPDDLRDALRNVLENAVRYAPDSEIRTSVRAQGESVAIRIEDDGPGMDPFVAAHAFDRFFRGADRGAVPGSGLGLAIVRRVAERVGGRVTLATEAGTGTCLEIVVPRVLPLFSE